MPRRDCAGKRAALVTTVVLFAVGASRAVADDRTGGHAEPPRPAPEAGEPAVPSSAEVEKKPMEQVKTDADVLGFVVKDIDGREVDLGQYRGKVVVIVNVASKCGFTPQYEGLERLYREKKDRGLVILGFPADNFGHQEPGSSEEIKAFCTSKYSVTFPLFQKISVVSETTAAEARAKGRPITGGDQHPLYRRLAAQPAPIGGDPKWNFTKFVVDRSGRVVARFDAEREYLRKPDLEPALLRKVDELLGEAAPQARP